MSNYIHSDELAHFAAWKKLSERRAPIFFDLEITARCNNNCRHCYINLPAGDLQAKQKELSLNEIGDIADQAVDLGILWCLLTGGEPLLRSDFSEIYLTLRKKGLLVSLFTNACLVNEDHISFFKKYPPRDIEVSVYGVSQETYENVTQQPGSYRAFRRGLDLLLTAGFPVKLKAMALKSNVHELNAIAEFCRSHSNETFRFDPALHLRYDKNEKRNQEIRSERLTPEKIAEIEQADIIRATFLQEHCYIFINPDLENVNSDNLIVCGAGNQSFIISYDGIFRLCGSLWHPDCFYDLRKGNLREAWYDFVPQVRSMRSSDHKYKETCIKCPVANLCMNCPAHAYLETGILDAIVPYFCQVAHARAEALEKSLIEKKEH